MSDLRKIQRLSTLLQKAFFALLVIYPLTIIILWLTGPNFQLAGNGINMYPESLPILYSMGLSTKLLGILVSAIPAGLVILIFFYLQRLFGFYRQREIFTLEAVKTIKRIAYVLLIKQFVDTLVYAPLISLAMT